MQYSKEYVQAETLRRLNQIKSYRLHHCCSHLSGEFESMYQFILKSDKNFTSSKGILKYTNAVYWGEIRGNEKRGYGIEVFDDGTFYMGEFRNGRCTGEGFHITTSGDVYKGEFVDGKLNGSGCVYYRNIDTEVDGVFVNDGLCKVNTASDSFEYKQQGKDKMIYDRNTGNYSKESSGCAGFIVLAVIIFIIFKCCS